MGILCDKTMLFIGDLISLNGVNEYEITDNFILKRADDLQIKLIKKRINELGNHFEFTFKFESYRRKENDAYTYNYLDKSDWNYCVIEHTNPETNQDFLFSLMLSQADLHILFQQYYNLDGTEKGHSYQYNSYHSYIDDYALEDEPKSITRQEIDEIIYIYRLINQNIKDNYKGIYKTLLDLRNINSLSIWDSLKIVGLFSIIESLIAHNPDHKKSDNSISHQIKMKLTLLNNRFDEKIDFKKYFKGIDSTSFERVIELLYRYRSEIAHGEMIDFNNKLQAITDHTHAHRFLYDLTKKLIIQSLKEPQLIYDLKMC